MNLPINYVIVTRDRPELASRTVHSVVAAHQATFGALPPLVYIVDDSTAAECSRALEQIPSSPELEDVVVRVLQRPEYCSLRAEIISRVPQSTRIFDRLCSPLGSPGWNLYSARNFAFLYLAVNAIPTQPILLLDDDVLCQPNSSSDLHIPAEVAPLLQWASAPTSELYAIGPEFLGREDIPVLQYLYKASRQIVGRYVCDSFPNVIVAEPGSLDPAEDVPSGGMLLTNARSLAQFPLTPFYNEDWIWARMLAATKEAFVRRGIGYAAHLPPAGEFPSADVAIFQSIGEVIYTMISEILDVHDFNALSHECTPVLLRHHLNVYITTLTTQTKELTEMLAGMDGAEQGVRYLNRSVYIHNAAIRALGRCEEEKLTAELRQYFSAIPLWRAVTQAA